MNELTVSVNKTINAPIKKVFDAWLNPETLSLFMMPMPGMPASDVENDAREGGRFKITMHAGDNDLLHTGEYLEISRPNKLVFTWTSDCSVDNSVVTLNFTKIDESKTKVSLTHVKFINEEARANHEGGWENILSKLSDITCP